MEYFNFDPATEFQILEDIEFDETIQRPERVRFYTLSEQTTDAYEKLLPRGKLTRFQRDEIRKEIDRLQELYRAYVIALPEEYKLREPEYGRHFSWVHPIYATGDLTPYDWNTSWAPLFENIRQPGFYTRMIAALPQPFGDSADGQPYGQREVTKFVSSEGTNPMNVLPPYLLTRTQHHEDKTIDILRVPVEGSEDVVNFTGYYLESRKLEVPNPFADHPFLKGNTAEVVTTTAALKDVVPSLDAILTHGVPVTKDPYGAAQPFLKLYDVKLRDIPWSAWKSKFPPVDIVKDVAPGEPIAFPKPAQLAPPENVVNAYKSVYGPGVSVRLWLMNQLDGGGLIPELLRSKAIDNGSVQALPAADIQQAAYPETTIDECSLVGTNFPDFMTKGVLRRTWNGSSKATLQCVPVEFIKQERGKVGYLNRKGWSDSTEDDIKKAYVRRIEEVRPLAEMSTKQDLAPKTPARADSIRRIEVMSVFEDPRRFSDDKLRDIRELLKDTTLTTNVYSDPDGQFVFCAHSLAILGGDLEKDRNAFYDIWAAKVDGFRVCKFCGQHINTDVFADQAEFDEDGFLIKRTEAMEVSAFHGANVAAFTTGLAGLQPLFIKENAHDDTVYLLLSILQVLPTADKLEPLIKLGRAIAAAQFTKGSPAQIAKFTGMVGIATTALILQTHIPTLVPRRAFGSKPLVLSGYPRDEATPGEYTIVNTLIMVIQRTFEAFPTSFKGAAQQIIRAVLNDSGEIKKTVTLLLSVKSPLMTKGDVPALLAKARAYHSQIPTVEVPKALLPVMLPPKELDVIRSFGACPSSRPIWTSGRYPPIVQATPPLRNGIRAADSAKDIPRATSDREVPVDIPDAEIRTRLAKTKGVPPSVAVRDAYRANLTVTSRLSDMFFMNEPVRTVNPEQTDAKLRDIGRGFLMATLSTIAKDSVKKAKFDEQRFKDVSLYTLLADYKKEKAEVNKLRASERIKFVQRMAQKSDQEREVIQDLLAIGLAPYVMTNQDRIELAQEAQRLQEEVFREDEVFAQTGDDDVGVGQPHDYFDQGDEDNRGADNGDYGDYIGMPGNDGRDHDQPQINDDPERSI
jgi:hypothetical protein